jgi:type IV secretory pathway VirB3-like protein
MSQDNQAANRLVLSPRDFFDESVSEAFEKRRLKTMPLVKGYLVDLLVYYVPTANLFDELDSSGKKSQKTLAETFLLAHSSEPQVRLELLKRMADRSLYISGFFSDSLQRKLVDVDYYAEMGGTAYSSLAGLSREESVALLFQELSSKFMEFADVLMHISTRAALTNEENIMRLYETFSRTGSNLAREKLIERGLIAVPIEIHKKEQ